MKNMKFLALFAIVLFSYSCTDLNEELRSQVPNSNVTAAGLLQSAYESMNAPLSDIGAQWALAEHSTDACLGPTRGPDWDDNGIWRAVHLHTWNADHGFVRDVFRSLLQIQFAASSVLDKSPTPQQAAEARFIRALSMYYVLDGWNQVPYRADLVDLTKLPETLVGNDASEFIISELNAIMNDLPDGPAIKANKDAARFLLMKMYLNKGTFADRGNPTFPAEDMDQVISLGNAIINSGKYGFTANFFDTFAPDNYSNAAKSKEMIYAFENTNGVRGCCNLNHWYCVLHYNQKPSGWNGFATLSNYYDKYEATDKRRDDSYPGVTDVSGLRVGYLVGQQYDQNGVALKDRKGAPLSFTREVAIKESGINLEVTGIRLIKYPVDYVKEFPSENEYVLFRYADALLMTAEAYLRKGDAASGLPLVNQIRTAPSRGVAAFTELTEDNLLDERAREMAWEGWRRNDLIRFKKFLQPDQARPDASGPEKLLFPIPNEQLSVNPNLTQNPGYN